MSSETKNKTKYSKVSNNKKSNDDDFEDNWSELEFYAPKYFKSKFSPVADFSAAEAKPIYINEIEWCNHERIPETLQMANTGQSLLIKGYWALDHPHLKGAFLKGKYIFSHLQLFWGDSSVYGSVHSLDGDLYPLEIQAIYYKSTYNDLEKALQKPGGIVKAITFFKIEFNRKSSVIDNIIKNLKKVIMPKTQTVLSPFPLNHLLRSFNQDYFFCWNVVEAKTCSHLILTMADSIPIPISYRQLHQFRSVLNDNLVRMGENNSFRSDEPPKQDIFLVSPSKIKPTASDYLPAMALPSRVISRIHFLD